MSKRAIGVALVAVVVLPVGGCSGDGRDGPGPVSTTSSLPASPSPTVRPVAPVELPADFPVSQVPLADGIVYYAFRMARGWDVRVQVADAQAQQAALDRLADKGFRVTVQRREDHYGSRSYRLFAGTHIIFLDMATPQGGPDGYTVGYTVGFLA